MFIKHKFLKQYKFLIIRFSSIGDIVLTSPIVRCIKKKYPNSEIIYLTKKVMYEAISCNPFIDEYLLLDNDNEDSILSYLKSRNIDYIIDLHKNLRSNAIKFRLLKSESFSFDKRNFEKWMTVQFKEKEFLKKDPISVVDRYFEGLESLEITNDNLGLDFFFEDNIDFKVDLPEKFIVLSPFAAHFTKTVPNALILKIFQLISLPIVLIGGKDNIKISSELANHPKVLNLVGKLSLKESSMVIKKSLGCISADTGMMHIASAFQKPIYSIWGNTIPEFGFAPYFGKDSELQTKSMINEVELNCRPCSKIGHDSCPKGHFKCMLNQDLETLSSWERGIKD